ncbi:GNAT family N-acetyltransferase [Flavobacterium sp.]|uniref:GNAT family N-acetyltransferase n=1 Tax=Flavobacterium sp. TaxID=239 RepID=UPI003752C419
MKDYSVRPYQAKDYLLWNTFINESKNGTFLFHRDFMEYHKERFDDFSLLIFQKEKLVALLPANRVGDTVFSHQGLTYGGLIYSDKLKLTSFIVVFAKVLKFLCEHEINKILIKTIPSIYHIKPSDEIQYVMFLMQAELVRRDSLSVVNLQKAIKISKGRLEGVKKGVKNKLKIVEEPIFETFWEEIMVPNLEKKHNAKPVHSHTEMSLLQKIFPINIRQFNVYFEDKIVAGTTIFETKQVAHAQYIAANETKNELGSLDYLYYCLLTEVFKEKAFLDFGISNEYQGKKVNSGLSFWKESFGASSIVQDFYEVATSKYCLLDDVLV